MPPSRGSSTHRVGQDPGLPRACRGRYLRPVRIPRGRPAPVPGQADLPKLRRTIEGHEPFDPAIVDAVAHGVKEWAMAQGATHYTHWFVPMTGSTAEKHDSFLAPDRRRPDDRRVLRQEPASRASRTPRRSRRAVSGPPSRRVATRPGTSPARSSCRSSPTAPPSRSPPPTSRTRAKRWTTRSRCCARRRRSASRRCASCAGSATRPRHASSRTSARSRSTSWSTAGWRSSGPTCCSPAGRSSGRRRPRARSWRTSTSARSASGSSRS